jgi:membrane-bound lytic murein transglycosylase B
MSAAHGFDARELRGILAQAEYKKSIVRLMDRAAGKPKPWHQYRPNFVNPARIQGGVDFWDSHQAVLRQAEASYGVPAEYIVAIIGVETIYGVNTGSTQVLDALFTLAFHYPRRADFFRGELEEFLLLCREEGISPLTPQGSYAGAMGMGQFMPSSWRKYGVDGDRDGHRNLWANENDVIHSIANYLRAHGWQQAQAVALPAQIRVGSAAGLTGLGLEPVNSLARLRQLGLLFHGDLPGHTPGSVIELDTELGPAYWLGLRNFYVITRYNRSPRYAMAVNHLAEAIRHERDTRNLR